MMHKDFLRGALGWDTSLHNALSAKLEKYFLCCEENRVEVQRASQRVNVRDNVTDVLCRKQLVPLLAKYSQTNKELERKVLSSDSGCEQPKRRC
jgi:hypothetical protein